MSPKIIHPVGRAINWSIHLNARHLREFSHLPQSLGPLWFAWLAFFCNFFKLNDRKAKEWAQCVTADAAEVAPGLSQTQARVAVFCCGPSVWKFPLHLSQVCFYIKLAPFIYKCMQGRL